MPSEMTYKEDAGLEKISFLKTIMMLCVVLYHSILACIGNGWGGIANFNNSIVLSLLSMWLNSFHIQLFTFASGYLFYFVRYECNRYRSPRKDFCKRIKRLIIPYVLVSIIWAIPAKMLTYGFSMTIIIKDFVLAVSPSQLWFLPMLFTVWMVFYCTSDVINRLSPAIVIIIYISIYLLKIMLERIIPLGVFQVSTSLEFLLYFYLGVLYRKNKDFQLKGCLALYGLLNVVIFLVYYYFLENGFEIVAELYRPILCYCGIILFVKILQMFKVEKMQRNNVFSFLAKNSMGVFLLHQQILYITMRVFSIKSDGVVVVLNFGIALLVSLMMTTLLRQFRFGCMILGEG